MNTDKDNKSRKRGNLGQPAKNRSQNNRVPSRESLDTFDYGDPKPDTIAQSKPSPRPKK